MRKSKAFIALLFGMLLWLPQSAGAGDEDTAYTVAGTALLAWAVYAVFRDDNGGVSEQLAQYAAEMAPWLIDTAEGFLNDADTRAALGEGNAVMASLALNYFAPRLTNKHSELAGGVIPLNRIYDYGRREYPVEFAMIYRVTDVGAVAVAEGLWPRLEAWLKGKGYLGEGSLYATLSSGQTRIEFTDEDRDELVERAARAIVEEYYAVKYGERIDASVTVAVADGLDLGGE